MLKSARTLQSSTNSLLEKQNMLGQMFDMKVKFQ